MQKRGVKISHELDSRQISWPTMHRARGIMDFFLVFPPPAQKINDSISVIKYNEMNVMKTIFPFLLHNKCTPSRPVNKNRFESWPPL